MAIRIEMPRLSDTMEEGTLLKFKVKEGDAVKAGDVLADVETDKATMEVQAFDEGTVAKLVVKEGDTVPVGSAMIILAADGESVEDAIADSNGNGKAKAASADAKAGKSSQASSEKDGKSESDGSGEGSSSSAASDAGRIRISPVARKMAEDLGVDISKLKGTGPDGRIIKRDVLQASEGGSSTKDSPKSDAAPPSGSSGSVTPMTAQKATGTAPRLEAGRKSLNNMRKVIAKRLVEAKTTIPHFQVTMDVDADRLLELRQTINQQLESQKIRLTVNDFIIRACASAIEQNPIINSSWDGDAIVTHGTINIGIAVAISEEKGGGLVVPVLKGVESMSVRKIHEQTRALSDKAKGSGLSIDEMAGSTFTVSNLGMFGVSQFNAIINPPNVAILAIGAAMQKPVVRDGQLAVGHQMTLTLSCDHRVVDGATGAAFLATLKSMLEHPAVMLI